LSNRRRDVSRIEGFSDAVFGFAVTLLVVSLEMPKSVDDLLAMLRGLPAFAVSFALLFQIWWRHYRFFRQYDLEDARVITLTSMLLFVVLLYVYPLKFLWSFVFLQFSDPSRAAMMLPRESAWILFTIYGAGVAATFVILAALYGHAYGRRKQLDLTPVETVDARVEVYRNLGLAAIGVLSAATALLSRAFALGLVGLAGYVYFLIGVSEFSVRTYGGRLRRRITGS
jgi:uncharacterized membrane protein